MIRLPALPEDSSVSTVNSIDICRFTLLYISHLSHIELDFLFAFSYFDFTISAELLKPEAGVRGEQIMMRGWESCKRFLWARIDIDLRYEFPDGKYPHGVKVLFSDGKPRAWLFWRWDAKWPEGYRPMKLHEYKIVHGGTSR